MSQISKTDSAPLNNNSQVSLREPGRVLLVDDSVLLLELIGLFLRENGWQVETALDGLKALDAIHRWLPEVIVCDLHMPEMDGLEVIRRVREIDQTIPVIVLSGDYDLDAVLSAVREGAFDYVLKADENLYPLLSAVEKAVSQGRLQRENLRLTIALQKTKGELEERIIQQDRQHNLLQLEKKRSEDLLLNILPKSIVDRLKGNDAEIAEVFPNVTVLFADIVDFTKLTMKKSPQWIVSLLNSIFSRFDFLTEIHGLEKIKTIGDAYMAATGVPLPKEDHAEACAEMALDMLDVLEHERIVSSEAIQIRIGLHSGPVVAGVIGKKKFIYDMWGETVNLASRMETHGLSGRIQVTGATNELLKAQFALEERGVISIKGHGEMMTYLLNSKKKRADEEDSIRR